MVRICSLLPRSHSLPHRTQPLLSRPFGLISAQPSLAAVAAGGSLLVRRLFEEQVFCSFEFDHRAHPKLSAFVPQNPKPRCLPSIRPSGMMLKQVDSLKVFRGSYFLRESWPASLPRFSRSWETPPPISPHLMNAFVRLCYTASVGRRSSRSVFKSVTNAHMSDAFMLSNEASLR